jgi:hypothetical protein
VGRIYEQVRGRPRIRVGAVLERQDHSAPAVPHLPVHERAGPR